MGSAPPHALLYFVLCSTLYTRHVLFDHDIHMFMRMLIHLTLQRWICDFRVKAPVNGLDLKAALRVQQAKKGHHIDIVVHVLFMVESEDFLFLHLMLPKPTLTLSHFLCLQSASTLSLRSNLFLPSLHHPHSDSIFFYNTFHNSSPSLSHTAFLLRISFSSDANASFHLFPSVKVALQERLTRKVLPGSQDFFLDNCLLADPLVPVISKLHFPTSRSASLQVVK